MELKSLTQQSECAGAKSGCLRILSECLGWLLHAPRVPFIAPRQLGAVGGQLGRPNLSSGGWCTGQSGAPPDSHCSCPVRDHLPNQAHPTVGPWVGWRTGQSDVPNRPLAWPRIARRLRGRPLALAAVGSPDSPVNYSRTPSSKPESGEFTADQPGAPDTVRCTWPELLFGCTQPSFFQFVSFLLCFVSNT
jgi:hypothetical protein